jgi:anaerobic selenocysteine-containing dehydrogenase
MRNNAYIRELYPVPELWINPLTAGEYGVVDKDWVRVSSRRGSIILKAWVMEGVAPGIIATERFWNPERMESVNNPAGGYQEMNINMLTKETGPYCPEIGSYTLRGFQVKIEKADAPSADIWTKAEDFAPWLPTHSENTEVVF